METLNTLDHHTTWWYNVVWLAIVSLCRRPSSVLVCCSNSLILPVFVLIMQTLLSWKTASDPHPHIHLVDLLIHLSTSLYRAYGVLPDVVTNKSMTFSPEVLREVNKWTKNDVVCT